MGDSVMGCGCLFSDIVTSRAGFKVCCHCYREGASGLPTAEEAEPDWNTKCIVCGQVPTLPLIEMCWPCTFGEAATMGDNW